MPIDTAATHPIDDDAGKISAVEYSPEPGQRFFALLEDELGGDEGGHADVDERIRLDVVYASDSRLGESELRGTSGDARRLWPAAFESRDGASELRRFLSSFRGGLVEATVPIDARNLTALREGVWTLIEFSAGNRIREVQPVDEPTVRALNRVFGSALVKDTTAADVNSLLGRVGDVEAFVAWDVGQGMANALLNTDGYAVAYSDVGAAFARNASTRPDPWISMCTCANPLIVLSHWDTDHWAAADHQPDLLRCTWVAPRQVMGKTHSQLVARILENGGEVHFVKRSSRPRAVSSTHRQKILLEHAAGRGKGRNDTGLVVTVHDTKNRSAWMFPGDADYSVVPAPLTPLVGLTAAHHGAAPRRNTIAPSPKGSDYVRLVYSFGAPNSYGHPRVESRDAHRAVGWRDQDTRDTTDRITAPVRGAVAVGWAAAPQCLSHLSVAHSVLPLT